MKERTCLAADCFQTSKIVRGLCPRHYNRRRRQENAAWLNAYKKKMGCIDCGIREGRRLDFDHRLGEIKLFGISRGHNMARKRLMMEMAKCDVRCASCHMLRHWAEGKKKTTPKHPPCFCGKPSHARGWCIVHYTRWKRYGDTAIVFKAWEKKRRNQLEIA